MSSTFNFYEVDVNNGESVVFVNSICARDLKGFFWLWRNLPKIVRSVRDHHGAFECVPALVSPIRIVMVSYWYNERELADYYGTGLHRQFMGFVRRHPQSLAMYFEKFRVEGSGKYVNGVFGLGKVFARK